jgi:alkanesulfonate monooxygenase SsuD/methylene tetrahydromethanopterin reductase-like flavin-dependent oxidoreductase (luciferase family)
VGHRAIEAVRALWTHDVASYRGTHVRFENVRCDPHPVGGAIPLHIGGTSEAAIRRAAKYGDGYFPFVSSDLDLEATLTHVIAAVRHAAARLGRDPDRIEMTVGGARTVADAERLAALGVDRLVIALRAKELPAVRDELADFGANVIAPTRDL